MLGSNLLALLGPMLSGAAINAIDLDTGVDFDAVLYYCALMAVFYAASSVLSYILSVMMIRLSQKIIRRMRQDVFEKLMTLPVGYFDRLQAGDIINRISYDIDTVNASLSNDILQAATGIITVVGRIYRHADDFPDTARRIHRHGAGVRVDHDQAQPLGAPAVP